MPTTRSSRDTDLTYVPYPLLAGQSLGGQLERPTVGDVEDPVLVGVRCQKKHEPVVVRGGEPLAP